MPKPETDGEKWFTRAHHVENLTHHPQSIKDDVLNTQYYSHYNQAATQAQKKEPNDCEEALTYVEAQLHKLKQ